MSANKHVLKIIDVKDLDNCLISGARREVAECAGGFADLLQMSKHGETLSLGLSQSKHHLRHCVYECHNQHIIGWMDIVFCVLVAN